MLPVNNSTFIDVGFPISKNFILEHVTSGAYHPIMARIIPLFTSGIIPDAARLQNLGGSGDMPFWKIVRNLQVGVDQILENLLNEFGADLIIRSGFLNYIPQGNVEELMHLFGRSFDIQIKGYESNMYNVAKDVQALTKKASELSLMFRNDSWIHIGFNLKRALTPSIYLDLVDFTTVDLLTGVTEKGYTSIRGFI